MQWQLTCTGRKRILAKLRSCHKQEAKVILDLEFARAIIYI